MAFEVTEDFIRAEAPVQIQQNHPLSAFPDYGLKEGDKLIVEYGWGAIDYKPDEIEVVKEYPNFILCKYIYHHWAGYDMSYTHCLNKVHIISGDIRFRKEVAA